MSRNQPAAKAVMTLEYARRTVARLAADLARLEVRERDREMIVHVRHACEEVEAVRRRLESGVEDPALALDEAVAAFERLARLRGRVVASAANA